MSQYQLGTDEAGYGPNLGPLVIASTLWRCTPPVTPLIGDSKKIYRRGSLSRLEQVCLGGLKRLGHQVTSYSQLRQVLLSPISKNSEIFETPFWERGNDLSLPVDATLRAIDAAAAQLDSLEAIKCRMIFPREFNLRTRSEMNKSTLLSRETFSLIAATLPQQFSCQISCDKHGGRNKYLPFLQEFFPHANWETVCESTAQSEYRSARDSIAFFAHGERFAEIGFASLVAKYVRELSMRLFNNFWQRYISTLAPTAGYPVDARRFRAEVAPCQKKIGISDEELWRAI